TAHGYSRDCVFPFDVSANSFCPCRRFVRLLDAATHFARPRVFFLGGVPFDRQESRGPANHRRCRRTSARACSMRDRSGNAYLICVRFITATRSEEHTSELQSLAYLVCRLLLEKKNIHFKFFFTS